MKILHGDCLEHLKDLPDNSVDSVVTDPPYALPGGFMGKAWDNHDGREDAGFGYWLAGFTDGEGCFRIQRHERGTHTCSFQIKLRRDDKSVLERIRRYVGFGTIRDIPSESNSHDQAIYTVQDQEGCEVLVGLFRKYPLTAKKALDFEVWADAVGEWVNRPRGNRWVGAADQTQAAALKERLSNVRQYSDIPWSGHKFQDWCRQWAKECQRVLKPGGHLLAFGAPRQYHRLAAGIEDAGFEIRDTIGWTFGSGFPKSMNLEKAGAGPEWAGWGTALKPAWESIVVARKPLGEKTVAENVLTYGTGGINIDGCRVGTEKVGWNGLGDTPRNAYMEGWKPDGVQRENTGRFPANLIHDGSEEVVGLFPESKSGNGSRKEKVNNSMGFHGGDGTYDDFNYGDSGSAARFFYCAKAGKKDRDEGLEGFEIRRPDTRTSTGMGSFEQKGVQPGRNFHPTVKPTDLMRYLCRLITPPGGTVLDPFMGSGSTGKAAKLEGFDFIGIEREAEYVEIAIARIAAVDNQVAQSKK